MCKDTRDSYSSKQKSSAKTKEASNQKPVKSAAASNKDNQKSSASKGCGCSGY